MNTLRFSVFILRWIVFPAVLSSSVRNIPSSVRHVPASSARHVAGSSARNVRRSAFLDPDRRFRMEWETENHEEIVIRLEVRTRGLVALGFSKDGTMVDSDFVVGWVSRGKVYLQDRYGEGNQMPELDYSQDWNLILGEENATHTTLVFSRKWDTCDPQDFAFEYDNTIRVMYAYSYNDPADEVNMDFQSFVSRGWRSFMLLQPEIPRETNVNFWDVTTNNIPISSDWDTLYWCRLFTGPTLDQKHHITRMEPRILGGHQGGYVHHLIVHECLFAIPSVYNQFVGDNGYDCFDPNAPIFTRLCRHPMAEWAKGGEGFTFPEHIGYPLEPQPVRYYMLQVHLDNANRDSGRTGQSGMRFHHSPNLRQFDSGLLTIGLEILPNVMAPPGVPDFVVAGHMNPDCNRPIIPPEGVRITSLTLHTHLLGRRAKVRHFRNNVELPAVVDDKHYDPEYQQFQQLAEETVLLPPDQLTLECTYDSTDRNQTTLGGFSTRDEMCLSFVVYYPRIQGLYGALSFVPKTLTTQALGSQELVSLTAGQPLYDRTYVEYMGRYNWNRTPIRRFEMSILRSGLPTICGRAGLIINSTASYPDGLVEYIEPQSPCLDYY